MEDNVARLRHMYVTVFLASFSGFLTMPSTTDVTMAALCPGKDECSLAIYLSGFQQAVAGLGSMVMTPLIGNLSDVYGRKALMTLPLTLSILPLVILAYSRETSFFYAYYVMKTATSMVTEGSMQCLSLAYVADHISEGKRASSFGILSGVGSAAFVCGTLAARFLHTAQTFQVAALSAMFAAVYTRIFLQETQRGADASVQPLLKSEPSSSSQERPSNKVEVFKKIPTIKDLKSMLGSSKNLSQIALMVFFNSLAEGGIHASLMYFLKARFSFSKNQFADLMLIVGVAGMVSQLLLMPMLVPVIGEERLLRIGLFVACTTMLLNSVAWEVWIIYAVAGFSVFVIFTTPCMQSIASKQVGPDEQGKAQGCMSGINSMANIISPLIFSPLTATFLSEKAPFYFPGFSLLCASFCTVIAFIQSLVMRSARQNPTHKPTALA